MTEHSPRALSQEPQPVQHGRIWLRRALASLGVLVALAMVAVVSLWVIAKPAMGGNAAAGRAARASDNGRTAPLVAGASMADGCGGARVLDGGRRT